MRANARSRRGRPCAALDLREHLVFQLCEIHPRGALRGAGFALDAEVERLAHARAGEVVEGEGAVERLAQEVRPAAGRMLFVAGDHERRAHAAVDLAASALAIALLGRPREPALDAEIERRADLRIRRRGAETKVVPERRRVDDLPGVEQAVRVPERLQLAEGLRQLRAKHALGEGAAHDPVAVFAAEGAAELEHEVGDLRGQGFGRVEPDSALQVDNRPDVDAADAGVAVVARTQAVRPHGPVEAPYVLRQPLRSDRRVLHESGRPGVAAAAHEQAEAGLAHAPHSRLRSGFQGRHHGVGSAVRDEVRSQARQLRLQLLRVRPGELDEQERSRVALDELDQLAKAAARAATRDDRVVHELDRRGRLRIHAHRCRGRIEHRFEVEAATTFAAGIGTIRTVASLTVASVPSEPTMSLARFSGPSLPTSSRL